MGIKIKQHDIKDCGAACLASVAAYYKLQLPIARIRQYAHTDKRGTNMLGLLQGAERLGFTAKGVKGDVTALPHIPLPTIAHVVLKNNELELHHYVVLYKRNLKENKGKITGTITYMDPANGKIHKFHIEKFLEIWSGVLLLLQPSQEFEIGNNKTSVWMRFLQLIYPHKSIIVQALFGAIVYTILGLSTSIYIEKITDYVIPNGNTKLLNLLGIIMLAILLLQLFINYYKSVMIMKTGQLMDANLILGYYKHLMKLPQRFFDTMQIGEITSRINDAVKIRSFINEVAINVVVNIFIVIFSFLLMFSYYWKLALIIAAIIPLYVVIYFIVNYWNKRVERGVMEDAAGLESQLVESLSNMKTIKQFGLESFSNLETENRFIKLLYTIFSSGHNNIFSSNSTEFLSRLFTIILLWSGTFYVIDREITPGELLSFYALIGYFTGPVASLIGTNKAVQSAVIAADRLFEIMDLEREEVTEKAELKSEMIGDIWFKNISFKYGSRMEVFKDFSIYFEKGKITAIVGESGSGKSTIAKIIQGLYPIEQGNVLIGQYDVKYFTNKSLRKCIVSVPQEVQLFSGNVLENITIGDNEPDIRKAVDICNALGMISFIEKLPLGFETSLGENGSTISGGQKQRIAIARALYKNPEILILDEATSSLDTESEKIIHKTIELLRTQNKTIIIIAHRLSTISNADYIYILENGKIAEVGNHKSLLHEKGKYYNLWKNQSLIL